MKEIIAIYDYSIWVLKEEDRGWIFRNMKDSKYGATGFFETKEECIVDLIKKGCKVYQEL